MPDPAQIPFLIKLLDDDSPVIRDKILSELKSFGQDLEKEISKLDLGPRELTSHSLQHLIMANRKDWLRRNWMNWLRIVDDKKSLEEAYLLLADYMNGTVFPHNLSEMLDNLAEEYSAMHDEPHAMSLAPFLFEIKGLQGAAEDYHSPRNSDMVYAIRRKQGLPITLACIMILVGMRVGLDILGCNIPGHFFAMATVDRQLYLIDCYNNGQFYRSDEFLPVHVDQDFNIDKYILNPPDSEAIIRRVLMNLVRAWQREENQIEASFFMSLLKDLSGFHPDIA